MKTAIKTFYKLRQTLRYAWKYPASLLGMNDRFFEQEKGARILVYHGICQKDPTRFNNIFLPLKTFEEHLRFYKKHFNVLSLDDYYQRRFADSRFNICISFDDGFTNNHKYVLPLMEKYRLPMSFFITAIRDAGYDILWNDLLGVAAECGPKKLIFRDEPFHKDHLNGYISMETGKSLKDLLRSGGFDIKEEMIRQLYPLAPLREKAEEDYWLQMTKEQIRELSASPFATIGSHGYYHNDLAMIDIQAASDEMRRSRKYLQNITGKEISAIAFPFGSYTHEVAEEAKVLGYHQLLAMDLLFREDHSDPSMRERLTVNPFLSSRNQMHATINGKYE